VVISHLSLVWSDTFLGCGHAAPC